MCARARQKGYQIPESVVISSCELPNTGLGNQTPVLSKSSNLNHKSTSQPSGDLKNKTKENLQGHSLYAV